MSNENEKSIIALELKKLKESSENFINKKERIPQPTFWISFNERIKKIKELKSQKRRLEEIFGS